MSESPSFGYTLSSEEFAPGDLARFAGLAERAGFDFLSISDHFHPWVDAQGQSPFVWATIGAISQVTDGILVGTGVTCPTTRIHPAIIAQAAATAACLLPGRFYLGVGAGENLNEHILGDRWPETQVRQDRLEEAVAVIRQLWSGELESHHGAHYTVENARIYTLPEEPPPIMVATGGQSATELAGRIGDGMVGLVADAEVIEQFERAGGRGKPRFGQLQVCWAPSEDEARATALERWPNAVASGSLPWELPLPSHFEDATSWAGEAAIAENVICGPDPDPIAEAAREYLTAGYDHVFIHQVGPRQEEFLRFASEDLLPRLRGGTPKRKAEQ